MTGFFGLDDEPAPAPEAPHAAPKPRMEKRAPKPTAEAPAEADPQADADEQAEQAARLAADADDLVELAKVVAAEPALAAPTGAPKAPEKVSPIDHVIAEWALVDPTALGLPHGSALLPTTYGTTGVEVRVTVPRGTVLPHAAVAVRDAAAARGWGAWQPKTPTSVTDFSLVRAVVGDDPATPWRAASSVAGKFFSGEKTPDGHSVRQVLFARAGLRVAHADKSFAYPKLVELRVGMRGPEVVLRLPGGLSIDAAIKTQGSLATLFRCPDLKCSAVGTDLLIALNSVKAEPFPSVVLMHPEQFWRPTSQAQRYLAAPNLTLPIGLSVGGEIISVNLAKRPHTVIAGQSGSGKSRTVMSVATGLILGGAAVAIGDFKGDPALTELYGNSPGVVHHSTSLAGISRLVLWAYDELARRSALLPVLKRRGITKPVWEPVVIVIDEWGQGIDELLNSPDPAERGAGSAMVNMMSKIFAQGRSFSLHVILSTQHVYASAIPGRIAQNAANRIIIGKPIAGPKGHIVGLFGDDKAAAEAAAEGIAEGMNGRGIIADQTGKVVQFQAHYGYTPAESPESVTGDLRESWEATRHALTFTPKLRRWGWRFPLDGTGEWQNWSLFPGDRSTGPLPTVHGLDVVELDALNGLPDPESAPWDPLSDAYFPGLPQLNKGHKNPRNIDHSN